MNTQINAYLAVGYACNQKCRCCPIANNANKDELIVPFERIEINVTYDDDDSRNYEFKSVGEKNNYVIEGLK